MSLLIHLFVALIVLIVVGGLGYWFVTRLAALFELPAKVQGLINLLLIALLVIATLVVFNQAWNGQLPAVRWLG